MDAYLNELVRYLVTQSWQIAVLAVVVAAATWALRHKTAHIRYLLWLIVLAKCLVPPLYMVPVRILPETVPDRVPPVLSGAILTDEHFTLPGPAARTRREPRESVLAQSTSEISEPHLSVSGWLGVLWIAGAGGYLLMNLLRALRGRLWLRRTRRPLCDDVQTEMANLLPAYGIEHLPRIWIADGVGQPFVWGLLRGSIYVPPGFFAVGSPQHRRNVLAHELSHVLRFDPAVNTLQVIIQGLFWFHPLVWWANRRIRQEREKACDEVAVARLGAKPKEYSTALVSTLIQAQESTRPVPSLAVAGPVKNIEERIRAMLRPGKKFHKRPSLMSATIILLAASVTVPAALVLTARADEKKATEKQAAAESSVTSEEENYLERLKEALARGMDVDAEDSWGYTIFHSGACMENYTKVAAFLIEKGANVNTRNITGITPLHTAAGRGHVEMVKLLLNNKADINARDDYGATPLWYAKNGVVYSFDVFGRFTANTTARWNPDNPGCKKAVALLVERGAIEHAPVISLHEAAHAGLMEKVRSLVAEDADVNRMDDRLAATPLHLAAYNNHREVVEFLIANGADVNTRNKWDRTPLHIAIDQDCTEIVELLRKHGARLEPATEAARVRVATSLFEFATFKLAIHEKLLEIPEEMQACAANLRKIHAAIKTYEKDKGQLPAWLSDLVPDYVSQEMLMCPDNPQTEWTGHAADRKFPCGYLYEFGPTRAFARFGGAPTDGMTMRDRKMAQVKFFGNVVPLIRCRLHAPPDQSMYLNISVGGEVYWSGPQWESWIMPDYKVGSELSEGASR